MGARSGGQGPRGAAGGPPSDDNGSDSGSSSHRWRRVYAGTQYVLSASGTLLAGANTLIGAVADKLNAAHLAIASQAVGDILYASTTTAFARLAAVGVGQVLKSGGVGVAPAWGAITPIVFAGHVRLVNPATAALTGIVNTVDAADGVQSLAAQPDVPRKLQVRIVDANSSISAGTLTLVGVGARGQAVGQVIPLTGGTQTVTTDDAYATLTSATIAGLVGAASGDTVGIGPATALGLPVAQGSTVAAVFRALVDDAAEAVGTVDATAGTIVPTTVPNGAHDYDFHFNYTVSPT